MMVMLPAVPQVPTHASRWRQLTAGITVARQDPVVGRCLVTVFVFSLLALAFIGQMPAVAAHNLGINLSESPDYGILYALAWAPGTGGRHLHRHRVRRHVQTPIPVRICLVGYSLSLCAFALERSPVPAYVNVAVVGAFYFGSLPARTLRCRPACTRTCAGGSWHCGRGIRRTVGVGNLLIGRWWRPSASPTSCSSAPASPWRSPGTRTSARPDTQVVLGAELAQ